MALLGSAVAHAVVNILPVPTTYQASHSVLLAPGWCPVIDDGHGLPGADTGTSEPEPLMVGQLWPRGQGT